MRSSSSGTILIVDDNVNNLHLLSSLLTKKGYEVRKAIDGPMAIMIAMTDPPDIILLDVMMPKMDGYEVCRHLKSQTQTEPIPVIFISALDEAIDKVKAFKLGGVDFVTKPFQAEEVLVRIEHQLELQAAKTEISTLNAELESRIQQRTRQLEAEIRVRRQVQERETLVNQIVQDMRKSLILEDILNQTVKLLHEHLKVSCCLVFQEDPTQAIISYSSNPSGTQQSEILSAYTRLHLHFRDQLHIGEMVVCSHIAEIGFKSLQSRLQQLTIASVIIVPLLYSKAYLGSIGLHQTQQPRSWTDNETILIKEIADHCAIAIHQAHLFRQANQKAQRERLLNQIIQALNSSLDVNFILAEIVRYTGLSFGSDQCLLFSLQQEQAQIISYWELETSRVTSPITDAIAEPFTDWLATSTVLQELQTNQIYYQDLTTQSDNLQHIFLKHVQTLLMINVSIRGDFFGGLVLVSSLAPKTYTEEDIYLLQRIADQTATALYNANSYAKLDEMVRERTKELEQEKLVSETANRAKSEFLATMSHELRTPLTSILTFSTLLEKQYTGPLSHKQFNYVKLIRESGEHLLELINDILEISKVEAGKEELVLEEVNAIEVCQSCITLLREKAQTRHLNLQLEIGESVNRYPSCWVDKRRLKQILFNLLSNAIKFTEVGTVKLAVTSTDHEILFEVFDTGIGISEGDQGKLFQPFQQLDSGVNRKYSGTGLGLALSRKLARLHNGDITVTSKLNQGSCFTLHLPRGHRVSAQPTHPKMSLSMPPLGELQQSRILLVEDNSAVAEALLDYLQIQGFLTSHVNNGYEFFEQISAFRPHLILLDMQLPEITGFEILQQLRKTPDFNTIPVIALTAFAMEGDRDQCLAAGAWDYISKPIDFDYFKKTLHQFLKPMCS